MKGFLVGAGLLTVLYVALQPNSASKLTTGSNALTQALHKFLSAATPGIPNLVKLTGGDNGNGTSTEAPGAPGPVQVPGTAGPVATPPSVISV